MLVLQNDLYQSTIFSGFPGLIHGYSTRGFGDARLPHNRERIVERLTGKAMRVVGAQQVHGNRIATVATDAPRLIAGVDGLVTVAQNTLLEVHVADCVPLLMADMHSGVVAAVHAGWKGSLSHIGREALNQMVRVGAAVSRIRVSMGPHIGRCCYTVGGDRIAAFQSVFGKDPAMAGQEADGWHLDIGYVNRKELLDAGVSEKNMDAAITCTSCQVGRFYSYRKDSKESFGEILGMIGLVS